MKIITKFNLGDEVYGIGKHRSNGIYINKIMAKGKIMKIHLERALESKSNIYIIETEMVAKFSFYGESLFTNKTHAEIECDRLNMEER